MRTAFLKSGRGYPSAWHRQGQGLETVSQQGSRRNGIAFDSSPQNGHANDSPNEGFRFDAENRTPPPESSP